MQALGELRQRLEAECARLKVSADRWDYCNMELAAYGRKNPHSQRLAVLREVVDMLPEVLR